MAELNTSQQFANVVLAITNSKGQPASVDGIPAWASSDETVISVTAAADGMSASIASVAPGGPARVTVSADADLGSGVTPLTGVTEDITVIQDPATQASTMTLTLGTPTDKGAARTLGKKK